MAARVIVGESARGADVAFVRLAVEHGLIVEADAHGIARSLVGLTPLEAAAVPGAVLAADALANALARVITAPPTAGRVAVAMSGGVDSAVALLRAGRGAVGVTLRLWLDPRGPSAERACCSPAAVVAARETCHRLGLPHVTLDLREAFRDAVVTPFVADYASGRTPNPCARCNGAFRFAALLAFAGRVGAEELWTGHYARLAHRDGLTLVRRGADPDKDQSYMLATVPPETLERVRFPLGGQGKAETRAEAAAAGLAVARRRESQEACFLAGDDYRAFLRRYGVPEAPGVIVDESGTVLGAHGGVWRFTPGQRRGIGVAAPEPLYALRTIPATATVVVGPRASLGVRTVEAVGRVYAPTDRAEVKLRYRSDPVGAVVEEVAGGFVLHLDSPIEAVAPGQVAALYDVEGAVVGAGTITGASR
jgi:tRNA-specific 2-thiouridylase